MSISASEKKILFSLRRKHLLLVFPTLNHRFLRFQGSLPGDLLLEIEATRQLIKGCREKFNKHHFLGVRAGISLRQAKAMKAEEVLESKPEPATAANGDDAPPAKRPRKLTAIVYACACDKRFRSYMPLCKSRFHVALPSALVAL
mgnify:CR=1 FL=1